MAQTSITVYPMKLINNDAGKLEIIMGCMFSGKSSSLINRIRQHQILDRNILVINHLSDTRYDDAGGCVTSHDKVKVQAESCDILMPLLHRPDYELIDTIFVEEAQFFSDLYEFVLTAVERDGKHIVVSGLDGDYMRKPYQHIMNLIPYADVVEKRNALCVECKDGTIASFSKRIANIDNHQRHMVGAKDSYIPVCRWHYNN